MGSSISPTVSPSRGSLASARATRSFGGLTYVVVSPSQGTLVIRAISTPMVSGRVDRLDARYPVNEPTLERVLVLVSTFVDLCVSVTRIGGAVD
ncbi:Uncharacterised protein [Mycobacteroides abscessus subsp. abscessus]|nr:Uncharacterised protein [Mycobacteroides abscessus subsp. abscessus]